VDTYFYDPRDGHGLPHDPFKAIVAPLPIGWISSVDAGSRVKLSPYSFYSGFNSQLPALPRRQKFNVLTSHRGATTRGPRCIRRTQESVSL
jgi:hypothetical protein